METSFSFPSSSRRNVAFNSFLNMFTANDVQPPPLNLRNLSLEKTDVQTQTMNSLTLKDPDAETHNQSLSTFSLEESFVQNLTAIFNKTETEDDNVPIIGVNLRNYQASLLGISKTRNIIACLPTGSGKTAIACALIRHFKKEIKGGKRVLFIAPTIPLCKQQSEYIAKHTGLISKAITGNNSQLIWKSGDKQTLLSTAEIFVVTPQLLFDWIQHSMLTWEMMILLVIDECHNAIKSNPIALIMKNYQSHKTNYGDNSVPRILGLSATIIKKNVKIELLKEEIKEIEKLLDSIALTYEAYQQVLECSAKIETLYYEAGESSSWPKEKYLRNLFTILEFSEFSSTHSKANPIPNVNHPSFSVANLFSQPKNAYNDLKRLINEVIYNFVDTGPIGALYTITDIEEHMKTFYRFSDKLYDQKFLSNIRLFKTSLMEIQVMLKDELQTIPKSSWIKELSSFKLKLLFKTLLEFKQQNDKFCCLIFVDRRVLANTLHNLFKFAKKHDDRMNFINSNIMVGTNQKSKSTHFVRVSPSEQQEILQKFRKNIYNVLICTSVIEEGLDVSECNLVIRYDTVKSCSSLIQSKGRARSENAKFCVLVERSSNGINNIQKYLNTNNKLNDILSQQMSLINLNDPQIVDNEDDVDNDEDEIDEYIPPFKPYDFKDAPIISANTCISIVNRYSSLLKDPKYTVRQRVLSWWTDHMMNVPEIDTPVKRYKAYILILPEDSEIKNIVEGPHMKTVKGAKKAVHLKFCELLFNKSLLDDHLLPRSK